ncbi:hypothetical protein BSKO_00551 [Bryopsis sp. KO-2023]|nr:hypothetical protein BSKO_00551 [Bryopsis sp. KO-2023]
MGKGKKRHEAGPAQKEQNAGEVEDVEPSSSDSSGVEDTGRISRTKENKFLENLLRIRRKDKDIFEKDTKLFSSSSEDEEEGALSEDGQDQETEPAPLYLKDVQTGRLMTEGADVFSTSEEEEEEEDDDDAEGLVEGAGSGYDEGKRLGNRIRRLNYNQDQKLLRSQFLEAAAQSGEESDGNDFGGLMRVDRDEPSSEEDEEEVAKTKALLDNLFDKGESLTKDDAFLKDFIANQQWVEAELSGEEGEDEGPDPNKDEEFLEKADTYEATYNYRFEEPGSAQIVTYPRFSSTSLRKTEGKRKRRREKKKQKKAEKMEKDLLALKTEKNLKRKQIQSKIEELSAAAGGGAPTKDLLDELLKGDFDMDDWDARMAATYNDDYYEHDDGEWDGAPKDETKKDAVDGDEAEEGDHKRQKATREISSEGRAELQNLIQDYYGLDHEENIDGVKCRFRYVQVPKDSFGLTVEEILSLDDKDLNAFVGRRQLDPYREDAKNYKVNPYKLKDVKRKVDYSRFKRKHEDDADAEKVPEPEGKDEEKIDPEGGAEDETTAAEVAKQKRLASYSRDTLQPKNKKVRDDDPKKKKRKQQVVEDPSKKLPKSQRKNLARKRRRESKRGDAAKPATVKE